MGNDCSVERSPTKPEKIIEIRQNANKKYIYRMNKYDKSIHGDYFDYLLKIQYQYEKEVDYSHIINKNEINKNEINNNFLVKNYEKIKLRV